jgi:hypothetical protein
VSRGEGELLSAPKPRAVSLLSVCLAVKPVGEPDAGDRHVRFDERGWETGRWPLAPSYRAHPRLYPNGHAEVTPQCPLRGYERTLLGPAPGVKSLCWGFKLQGLTWSFVELTSHFVQMGLRVHR